MAIDAQFRWGDIDDDENDYDFHLPPKQVTEGDEKRSKIETTSGVSNHGRRSWRKFGDAADEKSDSGVTTISTNDIFFERSRAPESRAEEANTSGQVMFMVCRICHKKGEHWTAKCPYYPQTDEPSTSISTGASTSGTVYVPPGMRAGASDMRKKRNDENSNSVRVTNLSEDTREEDLAELFRPFGAVTRVYVAMDQKTGMSRGFGFVNFVNRLDAERAISKLNGYGYDNLILKVESAHS